LVKLIDYKKIFMLKLNLQNLYMKAYLLIICQIIRYMNLVIIN